VSPQPKRKPTPAELKEARQKKIAIGGAVILVILLAVLGPHTFKQLHHSQQSTLPPSMRGLAPTATAATQTAPAAALSQLSDTDIVTVQPGSGQLVSFSLFKSKDPFVQQLASATPAATTPSAAPAVPSQPAASKQTVTIPSPATTPAVTAPTPTVVTPVTPAPTPTSPARTTPAPKPTAPAPTPVGFNSAAISTNGYCEIVPVKGTFPKDDQVFRLVSIAANGASVKIAVAGGSYQSGASAVTLKRGTVLTLVNTADGVRYRLSLLTECPASSGGSSAKTTPTPAPTTPTTTTTTTTATTTTSATTAPTTTVATPTSTTSTTP